MSAPHDSGGHPGPVHEFRPALATALGDDGTPITQTAAVLGHRNIDTTGRVYAHPTVAADAATQRGERRLGPPVESV
jgi:integrase